jgi:hypothetical protein
MSYLSTGPAMMTATKEREKKLAISARKLVLIIHPHYNILLLTSSRRCGHILIFLFV